MSWLRIRESELSPRARSIIHEWFRRGNLEKLLHPGQRRLREAFYQNTNTISLFNTARQFGKSFLMLTLAFEQCLKRPRSLVFYATPFQSQTEQIVRPRMAELASLCPPELRPRKAKNVWTFPNGSTITTLGVDRDAGDRMRGVASHLTILDECGFMNELEYIVQSICIPQFVTTQGKLVLVSTPPTSPSHPFTQNYIMQALARGFYWDAKWYDNPMLTRDYLENSILPNYPGGEANTKFRQEYLADYTITDFDKRVIPEFDRASHEEFFLDYREPEVYQPWVGIDFGTTAYTAIVFGYADFRLGKFIIQREYLEKYASTRDLADNIRRIEAELWSNRPPNLPMLPEPKRIADSNEQRTLIDFIREYDIKCVPVRKSAGRHAMINNLRTMLDERQDAGAQIRVDVRRCPMLSSQLENGVWNKSRTDYEYMDDGSHLDALDALKYLALEANFNNNPFSQMHYDKSKVFVPQQQRRKLFNDRL